MDRAARDHAQPNPSGDAGAWSISHPARDLRALVGDARASPSTLPAMAMGAVAHALPRQPHRGCQQPSRAAAGVDGAPGRAGARAADDARLLVAAGAARHTGLARGKARRSHGRGAVRPSRTRSSCTCSARPWRCAWRLACALLRAGAPADAAAALEPVLARTWNTAREAPSSAARRWPRSRPPSGTAASMRRAGHAAGWSAALHPASSARWRRRRRRGRGPAAERARNGGARAHRARREQQAHRARLRPQPWTR